MAPEGTDLILSSDIPNGEADLLVFDSLNVEANGRDGGNNFSELQFVKDGGLSGSVKSNHKDSHVFLRMEEVAEDVSHCDGFWFLFSQENKRREQDGDVSIIRLPLETSPFSLRLHRFAET